MLNGKLGEKPPEFDDIVSLINKSLKDPGVNDTHREVLLKCINYLEKYNDRHWYCDPYIAPVASHTLVLFSFPNNQYLKKHKPLIEERITECPDCVMGFNNGKYSLYSTFAVNRLIPPATVEKVLASFIDWEISVFQPKIDTLVSKVKNSEELTESDSSSLKVIIHLCLQDSYLLERQDIMLLFNILWEFTQKNQVVLETKSLSSGLIFLLFNSQSIQEKETFRLLIDSLPNKLTSEHPNNLSIKEFSKYLYRVQDSKYYNDSFCVEFWTNCYLIFQKIEPSHFMEFFNSPRDIEIKSKENNIMFSPLTNVLCNQLRASINKPLPFALDFLTLFLQTLKHDSWKYFSPIMYGNLIDFIIQNKFFKLIIASQDTELVKNCLAWLQPLRNSLSGTSQITATYKTTRFFLSILNLHQIQSQLTDSSLVIISCVVEQLISCFDVDKLSVHFKGFEVEILGKRDIRAIIDEFSVVIKDLILHHDLKSDLKNNLFKLIGLAFTFDLLILSFNSSLVQNKVLPKIFDSFPILWSNATQIDFTRHKELVLILFQCLDKASGITNFTPKKKDTDDRKLLEATETHNNQVVIITTKINSIMEKLSMADLLFLISIFEVPESMRGFWTALFSSVLSQNVLDILYQALDVEARYEGIQELLMRYLTSSLEGIVLSVRSLTELHAFEPCPRAVRVLMDIVIALNKDIIASHEPNDNSKRQVIALWECCWEFLVMLYKNTLKWANFYHSEQLVEFTRDTLDLSHSLMDSYAILNNFVDDREVSSKFSQQVLDVFDSIIVWLRLGDPSLLSSCVSLVFKGIDSATENKMAVKDDTLVLLLKYATKAKKYNNKLTEQQRTSIISKVRELNRTLADQTLIEIAASKSSESSRSSSPAIESFKAQKLNPNLKQMQLNFSKASGPVLAPEVQKEVKLSTLDLMRSQLKNQRIHSSKPIAAPAEARPAGFNPKKVQVGRSLNSLKKKPVDDDSSDDDLDDNDVDTSDLFIDKKKKPKVTEIDIHGRPIKRISGSRGIDREQLEQQRMQQRLNVDMTGLYHKILKWNFNSSNFPVPNMVPSEKPKDSYANVKEYSKSVEPLLMLECWAGIQSAKERGDEKPFDVFLGTRLSCDGFFDLVCTIKRSDIADRKITEADLIVLCAAEENLSPREASKHMKHPSTLTCLAKIKQIKYFNPEVSDVTIRVASSGPMLGLLGPKTPLLGMKVMPMVTVEREYSSLKGLEYYDLCDNILKAVPSKPSDLSSEQLQSAMKTYNVNKSQANAILGTQSTQGFSLIQGPPGTGKTKTILGIVGYNLRQVLDDPTAIIDTTKVESRAKEEKILICAPSNAAVDELVLRLKDGVRNSAGKLITPKVVRLGRSDAVNAAVKDFTLEELVEAQLAVKNLPNPQRSNDLKQEHIKLNNERKSLIEKKKRPDIDENEAVTLDSRIREVTKKRNNISQQLDAEREKNTIATRTKEIERKKIQENILNNAQVICSTLSGSAHDFVANLSMKFNKVIIDEACQCVELSSIIPLRYGCHQCIMVGDPNQLPPTVLSQAATKLSYDQSLFVRMQKSNPNAVYLLDVQYRMHPAISKFPSKNFYDGRLKDGEGMLQKNTRAWHQMAPLNPYNFLNVTSSHRQDDLSKSLFNTAEATIILELVEEMLRIMPGKSFSGLIGIISPYKEQIRVLRRTFAKKFGELIFKEIDFNTVDGFQGQEKDIIIMSCVRASENGGVGFLSDIRRMNVALTRAKSTLWILGNASSLSKDRNWRSLIEDAKQRGSFLNAHVGFLKKYASSGKIQPIPDTDLIELPQEEAEREAAQEDLKEEPNDQISDLQKQPPSSDTSKETKPTIEDKTSDDNKGTDHKPIIPKKSSIFSKSPEKPKLGKQITEDPSSASSDQIGKNLPTRSGVLPAKRPNKSSGIFINRKRKKP